MKRILILSDVLILSGRTTNSQPHRLSFHHSFQIFSLSVALSISFSHSAQKHSHCLTIASSCASDSDAKQHHQQLAVNFSSVFINNLTIFGTFSVTPDGARLRTRSEKIDFGYGFEQKVALMALTSLYACVLLVGAFSHEGMF